MAVGGSRLIDTDRRCLASLHDAWQPKLEACGGKPAAACCSAPQWTVAGAVAHRPAAQPGSCWSAGRLPTA